MNELEKFAEEMEQAYERSLKVRFNPLAFTMEEVNQLLADGAEPLPPGMWYLPESRKQQQITRGERKEPEYRCPTCGVGMSRRSFGCGPSGCSNIPC